MRFALMLLAAALPALIALRPAPATAGLHFCNKTSTTIWVAVAGEEGDLLFSSSDWVKGWWKMEPGECATPIGGNLPRNTIDVSTTDDDFAYYYYANAANGSLWAGDGNKALFCVDPTNAFTYGDTGAHAADCTTKSFRSLDTAGRPDYTLDLTL